MVGSSRAFFAKRWLNELVLSCLHQLLVSTAVLVNPACDRAWHPALDCQSRTVSLHSRSPPTNTWTSALFRSRQGHVSLIQMHRTIHCITVTTLPRHHITGHITSGGHLAGLLRQELLCCTLQARDPWQAQISAIAPIMAAQCAADTQHWLANFASAVNAQCLSQT
jgi:hypothetical protein